MSIKVYVNYDDRAEEILINNIKLNTDDMSFDCTAFEYGNALAGVMERFLKGRISATFKVCSEDDIPLHCFKISVLNGDCTVSDRVEGTYRPSIPFKRRTEKLPDKYLILVNAEQNKNEFYKMSDMGGGEWSATYGRIGEKQGRSRVTRNVIVPKSYPDYMFGIKLMEKVSKGYQDKSICHGLTVLRKKSYESSGIENKQVAELIEKLMAYAQNVIAQNYTVSYTDVTPEMIKQASIVIDCMRKSRTLAKFNEHLLSLMHIIPRKIDGRGDAGVKRMLASDVSEYADILVRETELLDIMEGQIIMNRETKQDDNILNKIGLTIEEATSEEIELVKNHLNDSLKPKIKQVFSISNQNTQNRFEKCLSDSDNKKNRKDITRLFWHGSRNANWFSILQKGLMLNPDAVITGKMFGNGIYFAPSAMKSWGYTSAGIWNRESSNEVYMALYETAYGLPYEVDTYSGNWSGYSYKQLQAEHPGCSCVHAKKSKGMLYNDEVIFYREDQVTIRYICTFNAA